MLKSYDKTIAVNKPGIQLKIGIEMIGKKYF